MCLSKMQECLFFSSLLSIPLYEQLQLKTWKCIECNCLCCISKHFAISTHIENIVQCPYFVWMTLTWVMRRFKVSSLLTTNRLKLKKTFAINRNTYKSFWKNKYKLAKITKVTEHLFWNIVSYPNSRYNLKLTRSYWKYLSK